jgi:hypothetical protein
MRTNIWNKHAGKLNSVNESPEPLRSAMLSLLHPADVVRLLLFAPASKSWGKGLPATLLALLTEDWVLVSGLSKTTPQTVRVSLSDTFVVELTRIPLLGRLRFEYATHGVVGSAVAEFQTVMEFYYKNAARLVLDAMEGGIRGVPIEDTTTANALLEGTPKKFANALREFRDPTQRVLAVKYWPAVVGTKYRWFQHDLAPEAMLALTERELILISDERTWSWSRGGHLDKYGTVASYCPLARLESYRIFAAVPTGKLDLQIRDRQNGTTLQVAFPSESGGGVEEFMEETMKQRKKSVSPTSGSMESMEDSMEERKTAGLQAKPLENDKHKE